MKRRFTILTAAFALLAILAIPMGMMGQTRTTQTAFYGFETGDAGWTATTFVTNNTAITAHGGSKYGATNGTTAFLQFDTKVANPQSLTCYYSKTSTNTNAGSHFEIQVSSDNSTWTTVATGLGMNDVTKGTWYELSADLSIYFDVYIRVRYDGTTAVRALDDITLTYDDGTTPSTDPEITFTPTSITLDEVLVGNEVSSTFSVSQANLTSDITLSVDNGSLSTSSIAQGADATNVTWTYTPTTAGAISATVTATSGTTTETLAISGTAIAPVESYDVNFEYVTDMYPNWTFDNMTTYQTGSITAHGGAYYGTTGGKATASITTTSTVANPGTLTCYVSKQSGNTSSSTWYIQVSENGSTWIDVESHSATSMSQGSWVEFTADLTDYTDVYVRVYYSGSTAIRNIDDLTLTTVEPSSDPSITAADVNIAYDAEEGTINYTINNPVEGGSLVASCDAEWIEVDDTPQTDAEGSIDFLCAPNSNFYAHSATVTLTYTYDDSKATITKIVTVTQALDPDANGSTIDYPIMVSEAIDAIDEVGTVSNIYVGGIVSNIVTEYSSQYHNITFDMIDEEGNEYFLRAYRCGGNEAANVTVGDEVIVYGNLTKYGEIYEFAQGCEVVSLIHPAVPTIAVSPVLVELDAEEHDGTLDLTYENLTVTDMDDFDIQYCNAEGEETTQPDWIEILVAEQDPEIGEGYVVSYFMVENEGTDARTAYFKVYAMYDETNLVYSNLVTISQAAPVAPATGGEYALYTGELVEGDYLIVYDGGAMNTTVTSDRLQYEDVTVNNDVITTDNAAIVWHIAPSGQYWTIYNANADAYAASTGVKNKAQMLADGTDDKALWTVSGTETYEFVNKKNSESNVNANLRKNGTYGFACYAASTGGALSLYKKVAEPATETHTLTINGYQNDENEGGYALIASPVNVDPAAVGMTSGDFDLYYFDESQELEWRNYEATPFNLVPGKGYLYAKKATTENLTYSFELTGTPYSGNGTVDLTYTENAEFAGFNLIGNPFGTNANLDLPYYRLNSDGSALNTTTENSEINVMEGVFVQVTAANQKANFTKVGESAKKIGQLNVKVTRNRSVILDNAIIRFDEGATLSKFQLNANSTKLYFTEGNQDFAVVRSANEGEMPINFKASENGTYTISINAENVDVNYLHLIDNMTGADVDLLATPSYSFEAKVTDYTNRFRLVFNANSSVNEQNSETFAFFNGSNLVINNEGEATLQVIDMMGRMISSEQIQGSYSNSLNLSAGVYVLRLSNGNNVKTQKIVID